MDFKLVDKVKLIITDFQTTWHNVNKDKVLCKSIKCVFHFEQQWKTNWMKKMCKWIMKSWLKSWSLIKNVRVDKSANVLLLVSLCPKKEWTFLQFYTFIAIVLMIHLLIPSIIAFMFTNIESASKYCSVNCIHVCSKMCKPLDANRKLYALSSLWE